jgi:hypothetical protein
MFHGKNIKLIVIIILVLAGILLLTIKKEPLKIIENRINLTLPVKSKILKFDYNRWSENFNAKVLNDSQDVESLKRELIEYFGPEYIYEDTKFLPHIENTVKWWDLDKNSIVVCYETMIDGKKHWLLPSPKTVNVWAFIVKKNQKQYYLYISSI